MCTSDWGLSWVATLLIGSVQPRLTFEPWRAETLWEGEEV